MAREQYDLARATYDRIAAASVANAAANYSPAVRSIADLPKAERVIVIANGPGLRVEGLRWSLPTQAVCVDGALGRLVRAGLYPDLVVSADSHARIAHWFGAKADGYFTRIGESGVTNEYIANVPVAIATASHPRTVDAAEKAGARLYWFHAMLDDPSTDGLTRRLYDAQPLPVVNGGGNVGTAAWVITHAILGAKDVALVGFDFGYPPDFPPERTQYAPELRELYGDAWQDAFTRYPSGWYADPAMAWFRDVFLEMAATAPCRTVNCGEGTLDGLERMTLEAWLG